MQLQSYPQKQHNSFNKVQIQSQPSQRNSSTFSEDNQIENTTITKILFLIIGIAIVIVFCVLFYIAMNQNQRNTYRNDDDKKDINPAENTENIQDIENTKEIDINIDNKNQNVQNNQKKPQIFHNKSDIETQTSDINKQNIDQKKENKINQQKQAIQKNITNQTNRIQDDRKKNEEQKIMNAQKQDVHDQITSQKQQQIDKKQTDVEQNQKENLQFQQFKDFSSIPQLDNNINDPQVPVLQSLEQIQELNMDDIPVFGKF